MAEERKEHVWKKKKEVEERLYSSDFKYKNPIAQMCILFRSDYVLNLNAFCEICKIKS